MNPRSFRFGVVAGRAASGEAWAERARQIEATGFATLLIPDRLGRTLAPLPALAVAAAATRTLRVGTFVIANGLRNPQIMAWESATLDFLSGGRFELGLGTGVSDEDFRQAGVSFEKPGARIDRLAETIRVVKAFFASGASAGPGPASSPGWAANYPPGVQRPHPPMLIAGAGSRLLALAAQEADIVALGVGGRATETELAEKIDLVRQAAGPRFDQIELSLNLLAVLDGTITPAMRERIRMVHHVEVEELTQLHSPLVVAGSAAAMADHLVGLRERLGVSYVTVPDDQVAAFAPVVARLAGK
jgi:probable F420-dependent oxidoreductase